MSKSLIISLLIPFFSFSQKDPGLLIDKYLREKVRSDDFCGVVLVAQKDKIIYKKAFGSANKEWNIPNTVETKFRIGSNTKTFTAAAILQLVDSGLVRLDDSLCKFFSDFPKGDSVTIRMLLNHTSGIKNYSGIRNFTSIHTLPYAKDSIVAFFKNQPYDFTPGTRWAYNNSAFFLLGCIIEKVSGQSFSAYIEKYMLPKADMRNTGLNNLDSILENRAAGYQRTNTGWKNAVYISMEFPFSAGAMYSTAEDLYKWNTALYSGKILSSPLLQEMTAPTMNNYGLGLRIDSFYKHKRIGHSGTIPGFESHNVWFPAEDLSIILLTNNESNLNEISEEVEAIIFKKPKVVIDTSMLNAFAGIYRSSDHVKLIFTRCGNSLCFVDGINLDKLQPSSPNSFFYGFTRRRYFTFTKNQFGKMKLLFMRNGGLTSEFEKVD